MSNLKTVDMSAVVGSDTLCEYGDILNEPFYFDQIGRLSEIKDECDPVFCNSRYINGVNGLGSMYCRISENYWQSTANNIVIPEGLVCDVRWLTDFEGGIIETKYQTSENIKEISEAHDCDLIAVCVTGLAEGWRYEWMGESES